MYIRGFVWNRKDIDRCLWTRGASDISPVFGGSVATNPHVVVCLIKSSSDFLVWGGHRWLRCIIRRMLNLTKFHIV